MINFLEYSGLDYINFLLLVLLQITLSFAHTSVKDSMAIFLCSFHVRLERVLRLSFSSRCHRIHSSSCSTSSAYRRSFISPNKMTKEFLYNKQTPKYLIIKIQKWESFWNGQNDPFQGTNVLKLISHKIRDQCKNQGLSENLLLLLFLEGWTLDL